MRSMCWTLAMYNAWSHTSAISTATTGSMRSACPRVFSLSKHHPQHKLVPSDTPCSSHPIAAKAPLSSGSERVGRQRGILVVHEPPDRADRHSARRPVCRLDSNWLHPSPTPVHREVLTWSLLLAGSTGSWRCMTSSSSTQRPSTSVSPWSIATLTRSRSEWKTYSWSGPPLSSSPRNWRCAEAPVEPTSRTRLRGDSVKGAF